MAPLLTAGLLLAAAAASYACGRYAPVWAGGFVALGALVTIFGAGADSWVPAALVSAPPWLIGRLLNSRERMVASLADRTQELEAERDALARLSVRHERARIARELHDIVAHHLAVIVVQAGAGRVSSEGPDDAGERFARIRQSGEDALSEMSRLVDLLQSKEQGQRELTVLLEQARSAGLKLDSRALPTDLSLPPEVEQLAYRVVQEGLTNAMKHAPGSEVRVRFELRPDELEIELLDHGGQEPSALAETGSGMGLRGLRERLAAMGGALDTGPAADGWRLLARLPTTPQG